MKTVEDTEERPRPTPEAYKPGQQIAARYEVIALLGRGGSATVYRALDHVTGEEVAVKNVTDPVHGADDFRREVRLAWRVTHPNVVRVFDIVEHEHGVLVSMQYAPGGTLADRAGGPQPPERVRVWALSMLHGLDAAHAAGVVHRDLKPANVLFDRNDNLLLSDFGVAQITGTSAQAGRGGTPAYMAPEQLIGGTIDARTDLYALGLILYECLSGSPAFRDSSATTLGDPPLTDRRVPPISGPLSGVVAALTHPDPTLRPADARAVIAMLTPRPRWPFALFTLALALIVGVFWAQPAVDPPTVEPVLHTLTSGDEVIEDAVTSLDDTSLIFASNRRGGRQLWSHRDGDARPLTVGPGKKRAPQGVGDTLYFHLEAPDRTDLYAYTLDELASAKTIDDADQIATDVLRARVAPDGRIASLHTVSGFDHQTRIEIWDPAIGRPNFASTPLYGPAETQITRLDWSVDGRYIAFSVRLEVVSERGALYLLDPTTGEYTLLTDNTGAWTGFTWLDDRTVAFLRGPADDRSLVSIDVHSGQEHVLARRLAHATLPSATSSTALVYLTDRVEYGVWVTGERGLDRVTSFGTTQALSPSWTDDGLLVYVTEEPGKGLEVRRVDGETFSQVEARRSIRGDNPYVAFSTDGRQVAYAIRNDDQSRLEIADIDDDEPARVLATRDGDHEFVVMSFSVDRLIYVLINGDGRSDVREIRLDGTDDRLLVEGAGGGLRSRDGQWFSYQRQPVARAGGVTLRPRDGEEMMLVPHTAEAQIMRFGPGETEITAADEHEVFAVDFLTGTRRSIAALPRGTYYVDRLSVGLDGRIAITLGVGRRSLVRVENLQSLRASP